MPVSKKKLKEIKAISHVHEVIEEFLGDDADFLESYPELWNDQERQLYDMLNAIQNRTITSVEKIINP